MRMLESGRDHTASKTRREMAQATGRIPEVLHTSARNWPLVG